MNRIYQQRRSIDDLRRVSTAVQLRRCHWQAGLAPRNEILVAHAALNQRKTVAVAYFLKILSMVMGVFLSWATEGSLSHRMSLVLKEWLPNVFVGQLECFVSSTDISAGSVWLQELFNQLEQSQAGIICVTRESMARGWMLFEAGALAKMIGTETQRVCPLLLDLEPGELQYPLAAFQWKVIKPESEENSKEQMFDLLCMVNESLSQERKLAAARLEAQFYAFWPQLWGQYNAERTNRLVFDNKHVIQVNNNEILVEMRSGFKQILGMIGGPGQIEIKVECPSCGHAALVEFYRAVGATRHLTCQKCTARYITHLDSDLLHAHSKLISPTKGDVRTDDIAADTESAPENSLLSASCPSCGKQEEIFIPNQPGATRHIQCRYCFKPFTAHRTANGIKISSASLVDPSRKFFYFLRSTKFWINPETVDALLIKVCEADKELAGSLHSPTPQSLKLYIVTQQPPILSKNTINIFLKILLEGGAFNPSEGHEQPAFWLPYSNRLEQTGLLFAFYRGLTRRLQNKFEIHEKDFVELSQDLEVEKVSGGAEALADALKLLDQAPLVQEPIREG